LSLARGIGEGTGELTRDLVEEDDLRGQISGIPLEGAETLSEISDLVIFHDARSLVIRRGSFRVFPKD
jgi:hypothetical protein